MKKGTAYLRAADIVGVTGMSLRTVRRWIADEILPSKKLGGARLVATADLERALCPCGDTFQKIHHDRDEYDEESNL